MTSSRAVEAVPVKFGSGCMIRSASTSLVVECIYCCHLLASNCTALQSCYVGWFLFFVQIILRACISYLLCILAMYIIPEEASCNFDCVHTCCVQPADRSVRRIKIALVVLIDISSVWAEGSFLRLQVWWGWCIFVWIKLLAQTARSWAAGS